MTNQETSDDETIDASSDPLGPFEGPGVEPAATVDFSDDASGGEGGADKSAGGRENTPSTAGTDESAESPDPSRDEVPIDSDPVAFPHDVRTEEPTDVGWPPLDATVLTERLGTRPNLRTVLNVAGIALLIALLVPFVFFAVPQVTGASESFVVLSGSMSPEIQQGDVVIVEDVDPGTVTEGDIITFTRGDSGPPTTHRVIDVSQNGDGVSFKTKGDANEGPDQGRISGSQLVGAVVFTIPLIGHVIHFAGSSTGIFLFIFGPLGLLAILEIADFVRDVDEDETATGAGGSATVTAPAGADEQYAVGATDLDISLAVTTVLAAYSGYMAYQSWVRTGIPDAISVAIAAGAVTGLVLGVSLRYSVSLLDEDPDPTEVMDVDGE